MLSVQYERRLGKHWSFNNTFFYRKRSQIPLGNEFDQLAKKYSLGLTGVDFEHIFVDQAHLGVIGYSPELRYYFGERKNRWFLGLFGQFEKFDAIIPASMDATYQGQVIEISKVPISFDIRTSSGGILIGKQFMLAKNLYLDVVIIGPHIGTGNKVYALVQEDLLGQLNESDRQNLEASIYQRFDLNRKYYQVTVTEDKAEINAFRKVPYASIRGFGLNLGFYF